MSGGGLSGGRDEQRERGAVLKNPRDAREREREMRGRERCAGFDERWY